jgi:hypothetical protein
MSGPAARPRPPSSHVPTVTKRTVRLCRSAVTMSPTEHGFRVTESNHVPLPAADSDADRRASGLLRLCRRHWHAIGGGGARETVTEPVTVTVTVSRRRGDRTVPRGPAPRKEQPRPGHRAA